MQLRALVFWRIVPVLILFVSLSKGDEPRPFCSPAWGENLNSDHCLEAILQFTSYRNAFLGSYTLSTSRKSYYFSDDHMARPRLGGRLVHLPWKFSHQNCKITIDISFLARVNPVPTTFAKVTNAIRSVYRKCVSPSIQNASIGGIVFYQGLEISIKQHPALGYRPSEVFDKRYDLIDRI
jgi:hypothetical protein